MDCWPLKGDVATGYLATSSFLVLISNARSYVRSVLAPFVAMPFVPSSLLVGL